jgi:hypothetical protein
MYTAFAHIVKCIPRVVGSRAILDDVMGLCSYIASYCARNSARIGSICSIYGHCVIFPMTAGEPEEGVGVDIDKCCTVENGAVFGQYDMCSRPQFWIVYPP